MWISDTFTAEQYARLRDADCRRCLDQVTNEIAVEQDLDLFQVVIHSPPRFMACPECGNKRCPKATSHVFSCTRSNESGQFGSDYR